MKKLLTLVAFAAVLGLAAQNIPPQAINFQGVAIDKNGIPVPGMDELGNPIQNSAIRVRFSILTGSATGTVSYQEEHLTTTDEFGRFNLEIGRGTATNGTFTGINWGGDKHFLQVEVDLSALGTNYTLASVQEFLSVPYALYSKSSGSSSDDLDKDDQNEIQTLTLSGDLLSISQGNTVTLPADLDEQQLSISGGVISISNGNSISLPVDSDNQLLTVTGNDLSISNGNTVALPVSPDNQSLSISGNSLSISNGNSVTLPPNTDNQTLAISGNSVSISNGNSITLPTAPDNQTLALSASTLSISNGNSVVLPTDADNQSLSIISSGSSRSLGITGGNSVSFTVNDADSSATNELQTLSKAGSTISLSNGGGSVLDSDNQSLSLTGNSLSISNGNSIALPVATDNQTLALSGSTLSISNGNSVVLPGSTVSQTLSVSSTGNQRTLSISNGNSVTLNINDADSSSSNEIQTLSINGNTISLSNNGGSINLPTDQVNDADADSTNELQTLSMSNDTLFLSKGGYVLLNNLSGLSNGMTFSSAFALEEIVCGGWGSVDCSNSNYPGSVSLTVPQGETWIVENIFWDNSNTYGCLNPRIIVNNVLVGRAANFNAEITLGVGDVLTISGHDSRTNSNCPGNTALLGRVLLNGKKYLTSNISNSNIVDNDKDSTNEVQTLSISNDTIFLSNGGYVKLPNSASNSKSGSRNNEINTVFSFPTTAIDTGAFYYNITTDQMAVFTYSASSTETSQQGNFTAAVLEGYHNSHTDYTFASFKASTDFFLTKWEFTGGGTNNNFSYIIIKDSDWDISNGDLGAIHSANASGTTITPMTRIEKDHFYHFGIRKASSSNSVVPLNFITNGFPTSFTEITEFQRSGVTGKFWKSDFTFKKYVHRWREL